MFLGYAATVPSCSPANRYSELCFRHRTGCMPGLLQVSKHCVPVSTLPYTAMLVGKGEMREQDEDQGVPVLIAIKFQCKALCGNRTRRRAARAARA